MRSEIHICYRTETNIPIRAIAISALIFHTLATCMWVICARLFFKNIISFISMFYRHNQYNFFMPLFYYHIATAHTHNAQLYNKLFCLTFLCLAAINCLTDPPGQGLTESGFRPAFRSDWKENNFPRSYQNSVTYQCLMRLLRFPTVDLPFTIDVTCQADGGWSRDKIEDCVCKCSTQIYSTI